MEMDARTFNYIISLETTIIILHFVAMFLNLRGVHHLQRYTINNSMKRVLAFVMLLAAATSGIFIIAQLDWVLYGRSAEVGVVVAGYWIIFEVFLITYLLLSTQIYLRIAHLISQFPR